MILYNDNKTEVVRTNDIVLADDNRLAIINAVDEEHKLVDITFINNGFKCYVKLKDISFVNHNNKAAAKSYRDLICRDKAGSR